MKNPLEKLLELGPLDTFQSWPDYKTHGFTLEDAPALIALFSNPVWLEADEDCNEGWVLLHAWRTLGQLQSLAAVESLLQAVEPLVDDAAAMEEIPKVLGLIGAEAMPAIVNFLQSEEQGPYARTAALDALVEIFKRDSTVRDEVVAIIVRYIEAADNENDDAWVNACAVADLIDLNATEAITPIRKIFAEGRVDIGMCGDLEDVEIELGKIGDRPPLITN